MDDIIRQQDIEEEALLREQARQEAQRIAKRRRLIKKKIKESKPPKVMQGVGFYMIVLLALAKEGLDPFLSVTIVLPWIFSTMVWFTIAFYMFYNGVSFTTKKVAALVVTFLIELVPIVNIFPTYPLTLFVIRYLENKQREKKHKEKMSNIKIRKPA